MELYRKTYRDGNVCRYVEYEPDEQATRDAALGAKLRELVGSKRLHVWAELLARATYEGPAQLLRAIADALEAEEAGHDC